MAEKIHTVAAKNRVDITFHPLTYPYPVLMCAFLVSSEVIEIDTH